MTDDPAIAAARAIVASNSESETAFLKIVDILEPLRKEQREWCVRQMHDTVNSEFKPELPNLLPRVSSNRQITEGEAEVISDIEE